LDAEYRESFKNTERKGRHEMKVLRNTKGFTLIELLVVVAIIGILAAIAIPQFSEYRKRGFDSRAESDLRNAATAEEAYFAEHEIYVTETCTPGTAFTNLRGAVCSDSVTVAMTAAGTADDPTFTGTSSSSAGTGRTFSYDSEAGGMQ
jgi:prepilin-type N-terminal cleavage/methylation domain-containing protein